MANCECLQGCIFFNDQMENMPNMASRIKQKYCLTDNSQCARYIVFKSKGKEAVPQTLFPHQTNKISELIKPE